MVVLLLPLKIIIYISFKLLSEHLVSLVFLDNLLDRVFASYYY